MKYIPVWTNKTVERPHQLKPRRQILPVVWYHHFFVFLAVSWMPLRRTRSQLCRLISGKSWPRGVIKYDSVVSYLIFIDAAIGFLN